jgi:hypothetical protein
MRRWRESRRESARNRVRPVRRGDYGLQLAVDEINEKGGLLDGRMIELAQRDDESSPPKG